MTHHFDYDHPSKASHFSALAQVEAYWEALRGRNEVPCRADIDPRGIQSALSHAFILEKVTPRIARFRLAGSKICQALGTEARGMPVSSLINSERREFFENQLQDVFEMPARATLHLAWDLGANRQVDARMLILPLQDEFGAVTRALGCLQFRASNISLPRRLFPVDCKVDPVGTFGHLDPNALRARNLTVVASNDKIQRRPHLRTSMPKSHLHLVTTDV
ncbi:MAG: PAS domain-containing protein [Cognatishimia sp.]